MTRAFAPGRVNLIGEHVDYAGGPVLPMAIDLGTTVEVEDGGDGLEFHSDDEPDGWLTLVAACADEARRKTGGRGTVTTTLPVGAGLSSSSSFAVAVLLGLGSTDRGTDLALAAQRAETSATGVPGGIMDQLASVSGVDGHALLMDCTTLEVQPIPLPSSISVLVVHCGQPRRLADSAYAERRASVEAAAEQLGPLPSLSPGAEEALDDPVLRARARHVIGECARVRAVASAPDDLDLWARSLAASHASLRDDFEVSTPALNETVAHLIAQPGVIGARLTGAGFGGCVVALVHVGGPPVDVGGRRAWPVRPSTGARILAPTIGG